MICLADWWTQTPSVTPLLPKKWNAQFLITFNFWWSARLVNGPEPHPPRLSSQKHEMLIFEFCSTSDDQPGWSMDSNPIHHPSPTNKMKCLILDYAQLLMIGRAGWRTRTPSAIPLQPKTWNACFCITFNIWCWPGCSMDSNPICHPLQPKKWNPHFWIMFNFWWSAGLVNGLEPHLPPLSTQKSEMIIFGLHSTSDDWPGWLMDSNPIHHNSSVKKWNPHFWITFNFWWSARLVNGLEPHLPPLSSQKNEMLIFGLCSTSDYWPGRSMDSNPICHPSPTNKMKCSFLEYVQLLMISLGGWWTQTPSASPLQPKKWNATFWITFNFWWLAGLVNGLKPHPPPLSSQRNEMLIFVLCSTSNDQPGLSMDLNPIHHLSPAKNEMLIF